MGILGFVASSTNITIGDTSMVNLAVIRQLFPTWVLIPFLFMVVSGLLSTVDSNLCAVASLTSDLQKQYDVRISKLAMIVVLALAIAIANLPGLTVTHLFLMYGTFRASTMLPTILTLKGVKLTGKGIVAGVICSLCVGMPIFAYGNIFALSMYKTVGSLTTVLLSGIVAVIVSRLEAKYASC
jgi:Na+/proline symporter